MNFLESVFGELGITQYLGPFIDQGFDSWETILDITESDLDALGVKLGHRRKLQRRIANYRGIAPDASLTSPTRTSIEDVRHDSNRTDTDRPDVKTGPIVVKRKYRRHPKPDEHAPERPPSAYVLFSNKMREDLKGQNLTFTEIAKLVGENWQNLGRAEKEPFEKQANEAKEKYNQALAEYKKTPECKKYNEYLLEFRKRQAAQSQEKDVAKRLKTDAESTRGSSTSGVSIGPGGTTSGTGSGSESQHGSEPPPSRQQRLGSIASLSTGTSHVDDSLTSPLLLCQEEANGGRRRGLSSPHSRNGSIHSVNHRMVWEGQYQPGDIPSTSAPWLDSRTASPMISQSPEVGVPSIYPTQSFHANRPSRSSRSSGSTTNSQPPSLKHEQSSHGSNSSTSPYPPRTPSDASLPIHALLSTKPESPAPSYVQSGPSHPLNGHMTPQASLPLQRTQKQHTQPSRIAGGFHHAPHYTSGMPGPISGHRTNRPSGPPGPLGEILHEAAVNLPQDAGLATMTRQSGNGDAGLDGISALLRAREIVDRRP
ncbi:hypothetical protein F5B22DRAFT_646858 [Xylaria bambusicola]|uniref:uncharacterized protein n=1 Tax=Xylaria bambusicola TaxID=326684 RepID=UPI0020078472|nr:uncharacterized protein F5B22DRAFT_646858 [Xylaria bambusicola]KAI0515283.1 hypothetical protein F5B22DRAFT_646858 [Xylaria bambusicola]